MTVSTSANRADYTGNGVTTSFAVPFLFPDPTNLQVLLTTIATGSTTTAVLNSDYTVSGAGVSTGGTVTMSVAPASTIKVSILLNILPLQQTHYVENDPFHAATIEANLDYLTLLVKQGNEQLSRALQAPVGDSSAGVVLPPAAARAGFLLGFDNLGNVVPVAAAAQSASALALSIAASTGTSLVGQDQSITAAAGTLADFLRRGFVPGPRVSGGDDTANLTAAINLAVLLNVPLWTGSSIYSISQLVLPSNLVWHAGNTKLVQRNNVNLCALRNTNETFSVRTDSNIRILGALTVDCNGSNQADTEVSGVLTAGVRFTGVAGLELNLTVLNPRRYGIWLIGCSGVRGNPTVVHNVSIPSVNKDGVHINGGIVGTTDVRFGVVTVQNGGDDALPLNADDVASGGSWTQANITGKIYDVHVDRLALTNCRNGVRLLSATQEIANVFIGQITGDVSVYAWNVQDYGLGSNSWYKNIRCNSISVDYKDNPIGATLGLINIDTSNPNTQAISDFWFGNIDRGQVGTVGKDRETVQLKLKRCIVDLNRVIERYCSNTATVTMTGGGGASELYLRDWMAVNSAQNGSSFWRVAVLLNSVTGLDLLKVGRVNVDFVRNLVVATSSPIGLLDIETFPVTTPANGALSFSGAATVISKLICRNPDSFTQSATFRYTLTSSATVTKEWPPYSSGTTAQRPTNASAGDTIFDATLNKLVTWNGSVWKDGSGATV